MHAHHKKQVTWDSIDRGVHAQKTKKNASKKNYINQVLRFEPLRFKPLQLRFEPLSIGRVPRRTFRRGVLSIILNLCGLNLCGLNLCGSLQAKSYRLAEYRVKRSAEVCHLRFEPLRLRFKPLLIGGVPRRTFRRGVSSLCGNTI